MLYKGKHALIPWAPLRTTMVPMVRFLHTAGSLWYHTFSGILFEFHLKIRNRDGWLQTSLGLRRTRIVRIIVKPGSPSPTKLSPYRSIGACSLRNRGRLAQLVERHIDVVNVTGSTPVPPTTFR